MYSKKNASRDGRQNRSSAGSAGKSERSSSASGSKKSYSKSAGASGSRSEKPFRSSSRSNEKRVSRSTGGAGQFGEGRPERTERGGYRSREEGSERPFRASRTNDDRGDITFKPKRSFKPGGDKPFGEKSFGNRKSNDRPYREKTYSDKEGGSRPYREKTFGDKEGGSRPFREKTFGNKESGSRPYREKSYSDNEKGDRPYKPSVRKRTEGSLDKDTHSSDRPSGGSRSFREPSEMPQGERTAPNRTIRSRRNVGSKEENSKKDDGRIRLNKLIAASGICSRREADDLIVAGLVTVNGTVAAELGTKVFPTDDIRYNGERMRQEKLVYIVMNKPKDFVTTVKDPHAKKTVMEIIEGACKERLFPVGRLDRNTTGVLLLTNDGDLTKKLTHPGYNRKKIYHVYLDKNLKQPDFEALSNGFELEDGFIRADAVHFVDIDDKKQIGIEIHSGRNRIVRRMVEKLGYKVLKLDRVYFCGLTKKGLQRGQFRFLTPQEVGMIKMGNYE